DGVRSRHTAHRADEKTGVRPKGEADFSRSGKQCAVAEPPKHDKQKCGWRAEQAYSAPRRRKNRRTPEGRSGFFAERQAVCRRGAAEAGQAEVRMACGAGIQRAAQTKKQAYARRAKRIFRGAASSVPSRSRRSMTSRSADG